MATPAESSILERIVAAQKAHKPVGIPSICSGNRFVVEATLRAAAEARMPVLLEATCNQVNQFGGYTGSTPRDFAGMVADLAAEIGGNPEFVLLGGDHLGPYPWRTEAAIPAMSKAADMVRAYVQAGFTKVHLDASMACADDEPGRPLSPEVIASRAALLCEAAEEAHKEEPQAPELEYVVGTEVPVPGGTADDAAGLRVTDPRDVTESLASFQTAFRKRGLEAAWQRVRAVVVQPGVEFGDEHVHVYDRAAAKRLVDYIRADPRIVFEAHSTDYQPAQALKALVQDQFAILKVGPALTFAFREAVFALALMEAEWLGPRGGIALSGLIAQVEQAMTSDPRYWKDYYHGTPPDLANSRVHSRLDRVRYYWNVPAVELALQRLFMNLETHPLPPALLTRHLPTQARRLSDGLISNHPRSLVIDHVMEALQPYLDACGRLQ